MLRKDESLEEALARAEREFKIHEIEVRKEHEITAWLKEEGIFFEGVRPSTRIFVYRGRIQVTYSWYHAEASLLGAYLLFKHLWPRYPIDTKYCTHKESGHGWRFPVEPEGGLEYMDNFYPVYPTYFKFSSRQNERLGGRGNPYGTIKNGCSMHFHFITPLGPVDFVVELGYWDILKPFGLYCRGRQFGRNQHLAPELTGWEAIHYQGGDSVVFIPSGWVWANGLGWEEDWLGFELERG